MEVLFLNLGWLQAVPCEGWVYRRRAKRRMGADRSCCMESNAYFQCRRGSDRWGRLEPWLVSSSSSSWNWRFAAVAGVGFRHPTLSNSGDHPAVEEVVLPSLLEFHYKTGTKTP